jgi:PEGA domain
MMRAALASVLLVTALPAGARAHDVDPDVLIVRGLELRRAGKSVEALELFRRAHREAPSPRTLGQMGLVETSLAEWTEADTHLAASLATPDDAWVHKNRPFLEQAHERAKTHLGELVLSGGRQGTVVSLAGRALGALPLSAPLRTAEGDFLLTASAPGFKPYSTNVSIKGGTRTAVTIVLEPLQLDSPSVSRPTEPFSSSEPAPRSARRWTGIALAAAGVGALTWGIAWIALDSRDACRSIQAGDCGTVYATRTPGWILAAGGGALALTGGAILLSTFHRTSSDLAFGITPSSLLVQARF